MNFDEDDVKEKNPQIALELQYSTVVGLLL